ncbi:MAG TPA: SRPBCC domain-containing protein [Opitutales bacterium]|nr:SRPBCC domain-containing protein [Opitutales bacterium]
MTTPNNSSPFVLSRTFKAPRELVWKAWTERERLMQWFGPKGSSMPTAKMDFRPGGVFHYSMRNCAPGHGETLMWGKWIFREIKAPERIVLVHHFSDENGGVTRHPFHPSWPLKMLSTTTFLENHGETTVTVQWAPLDATAEERQTFDRGRDGMRIGWSGTFEQLEAYLSQNQ